jgi:hypothetical protein
MTTFIKLTNGVTINRESIRSFQKEEHISAGMYARMFAEARREPLDLDNPKPTVEGVPSIQVVTEGEKPTLLEFATKEERDAEYDRLEAFVQNKPQPVFENLSLNLSIVQSVQAAWGYKSLKLHIKLGPEEPIVVGIAENDEPELEKAKTFLAHFGLEMPLTMTQYMEKQRQYDEKGNSKEPRGF